MTSDFPFHYQTSAAPETNPVAATATSPIRQNESLRFPFLLRSTFCFLFEFFWAFSTSFLSLSQNLNVILLFISINGTRHDVKGSPRGNEQS